MEERYVFEQFIIDKKLIKNIIKKKQKHPPQENNTITLLIMGHGRERYKENFRKAIEHYPHTYSNPFIYTVNQQENNKTIRILSKAGKPKICAWDYALCTKNMSSQDILLELSYLFFSNDNQEFDTLAIMNSLSTYFKTIYPEIVNKISRNYRDLPEDKDPGSPGAQDYSQRYKDFIEVLESLQQNKFSDLKSLNHEKVFTIRPNDPNEYKHICEKYLFEIVELRVQEPNELTNLINKFLGIRQNLVPNYYDMNKTELDDYINNYKNMIYEIYLIDIDDYNKYYLTKFLFNLHFGYEIMLSEIIEFFVILNIDTINIIDNTCRVKDPYGKVVYSITPTTTEIELQEKLHSKSSTLSNHSITKKYKSNSSKGGKKNKSRKNNFL